MVQPILSAPGKAASMAEILRETLGKRFDCRKKEQGRRQCQRVDRRVGAGLPKGSLGKLAKDKGLSQGESLDGRESIEDSQATGSAH